MQENEKQVQEQQEVKKQSFFVRYLKGLGYDFIQSFKYNNMKLAGLLILIPGAIFGFFLTFHTTVVNNITPTATNGQAYLTDLSGLMLFLMMLFGILNIFTGFSVMNKKNLGSVILALITSVIMIAAGTIYFVIVFKWMGGVNTYYAQLDKVVEETGKPVNEIKPLLLEGKQYYVYAIPAAKRVSEFFSIDYVLSLGSVGLCMVSSIVGIIFGFKNYDRNYEKVDR